VAHEERAMQPTDKPFRTWELAETTRLAAPLEEVFEFFADARNLERITPPWLSFRITTPGSIEMAPGALIDYRLRVRGVPLRWQSEITAWEPPHRFVDVQRRGPYRHWWHEHRFERVEGGTRASDRVVYAPPGGPLAGLVHALVVGRDVRSIFRYRAQQLDELFNR
jgi:ligand-binding SRPBCC domain-containing protein